MGKSVSAKSGNQLETQSNLKDETVQDTLETSDREPDGRQPLESRNATPTPEPPPEQGGILDLEG